MAITLGTLLIKLTASTDAFKKEMGAVKDLSFRSAGDISRSFDKIGKSLSSLRFDNAAQIQKSLTIVGALAGGVAVATAGALAAIVAKSVSAAAAMHDLAQTAGVSAGTLSALGYAAKQNGVDVESLAGGLQKLSRNISTAAVGTGDALKAFKRLGISLKDEVNGQIKPTDQLLLEIAEKFSRLGEGAEKTGLAMQIFGKSGATLLPFLNEGRSGIERLTAEAERLGIVISGATAAAADRLEDTMVRLQSSVAGAGLQVGTAMIPALNNLADVFLKVSSTGSGFAAIGTSIGNAMQESAKYVVGFTTVLNDLTLALEKQANKTPNIPALTWLAKGGFGAVKPGRPDAEIDAARMVNEKRFRDSVGILNNKSSTEIGDVVTRLFPSKPKAALQPPGLSDKEVRDLEKRAKEVDAIFHDLHIRLTEDNIRTLGLFTSTTGVPLDIMEGYAEQQQTMQDILDGAGKVLPTQFDSEALFAQQMEQIMLATAGTKKNTVELSSVMNAFGSATSTMFEDIALGTRGFSQVFESMAASISSSIARMVAQMVILRAVSAIFGLFSSSIADATGSIAGAGSGGGFSFIQSTLPIGARAEGGPVLAGKPYLVGERGPEIFSPSMSGTITPNHAMRSSESHYYDLRGSSITPRQLERALIKTGRATHDATIQKMRDDRWRNKG